MSKRHWALGGLLGVLTGAGLWGAGLELWPNPEPCRPCVVQVGNAPAYCPDERHEWRETWSDDWSTLHLECSCKE